MAQNTRRGRKPNKSAARAARAQARHALPPGKPLLPCEDPLLGKQFEARVNCKTAKNRKGKPVKRCDRQRVVVVGCASPTEDRPRARDLFVAQVGMRYTIPDREIRRDLRASGRLPAAPARKSNHHHGYHAPGDPLGAYMPPLGGWHRHADGHLWDHPSLPVRFVTRKARGAAGWTGQALRRPEGYSNNALSAVFRGRTEEDARGHLERWYTAHGDELVGGRKRNGPLGPDDVPPLSKWERRDRLSAVQYTSGKAPNTHYRWSPAGTNLSFSIIRSRSNGNTEFEMVEMRDGNVRVLGHGYFGSAGEAHRYVRWLVAGGEDRKPNARFAIQYRNEHGPVDTGARYEAPTADRAFRAYMSDVSASGEMARRGAAHYSGHRAVRLPPKPNRAPRGAVPGQTYDDGRPDPLLRLRVSGEGYAGPVRVRAVGCDGRTPSHVVGGHVLRRSRVTAGVRREEIRLGLRPAPARRGARVIDASDAPTSVVDVADLAPATRFGAGHAEPLRPRPSFRDRFGAGHAEPLRPRPSFRDRFGAGGTEPLRPRAPLALPAPARAEPSPPAARGRLTNQQLFEALKRRLAPKANRRR